jgi:hypothetical protein
MSTSLNLKKLFFTSIYEKRMQMKIVTRLAREVTFIIKTILSVYII